MRSLSTRAAGLLITIGGIWGGFAPFVGPYFHFTLGPDHAWRWTSGRLWLDVLPAIAAVIGGVMLIGAGPRLSGRVGALIALAAGIWFAVGPDISQFWHAGGAQGVANGSKGTRIFESLAFHTGLGVLIAALAGYALPGFLLARRHRAALAGEATAGPAATELGTDRERATTAHEPATTAREPATTEREPATTERAPATTAAEDGAPVEREHAHLGSSRT